MNRRTLSLAMTTLLVGAGLGWVAAPRPAEFEDSRSAGPQPADGMVVRIAALRRHEGAWRIEHRVARRAAASEDVSLAFPSGERAVQPSSFPVAPLGGPRVRARAPTHRVSVKVSYHQWQEAWLTVSAECRAEGPTGSSSTSTTGPAVPGIVRVLPIASFAPASAAPWGNHDSLLLGCVTEDDDPDEAWDLDAWAGRVVEQLRRHPSRADPQRSADWSQDGEHLIAVAAALAPPEAAPELVRLVHVDPKSVPGGHAYVNSRGVTVLAAVLCGAGAEEAGLADGDAALHGDALAPALGVDAPAPWYWHAGSPHPDARALVAAPIAKAVVPPDAARDILAQGDRVPADLRARARAIAASAGEWEGRGSPTALALTALMLACLPILLLLSNRHPRWFPGVAAWIVPAGFLVASVRFTHHTFSDAQSIGCAFAAIGVGVAGRGALGPWRARAVAGFVVTAILFGAAHVTGATILDAFANAVGFTAVVCTLYLTRDLVPPAEALDPRLPRRPRAVALRDVGRLLVLGLASVAILLPVGYGVTRGHTPPLAVSALVVGLLALVVALFVWWRPLLDPVLRAPVTTRNTARIPRRLLVVAWLLATSHVAAIVATVLATRMGEAPPRAVLGVSGVAGFLAAILAVMTAVRFVLAAHDRRQAESLLRLRDDLHAQDHAAPG